MRVAVCGSGGMLGKEILRRLSHTPDVRVFGYARKAHGVRPTGVALPVAAEVFALTSLTNIVEIRESLAISSPDLIVNCIGHRGIPSTANEASDMVLVNSWWPHQISAIAGAMNARLIHFSSDGVFSGRRGRYREDDFPDAQDLYGRSKLLGEPIGDHCLIIRTSLIGHDYPESNQLLDWFLRQRGRVPGYEKVVFSGLTTVEIAKIVAEILLQRPDMNGLWNIASQPISKYTLLARIVDQYRLEIELSPHPHPVSDRSLDSSRFNAATGYAPPEWPDLISELWHTYQATRGVKS
jgi:dTDP-4-dehydrorhamnose reductase